MDLAWWSVHHHLCCLCVILGSASFILSFHVQHHLHDVQHYSCCPCMMFSIIHVVLAGCSVQHYSCCPCRMFSSALFCLSLHDVQHHSVCLYMILSSALSCLSLHGVMFSSASSICPCRTFSSASPITMMSRSRWARRRWWWLPHAATLSRSQCEGNSLPRQPASTLSSSTTPTPGGLFGRCVAVHIHAGYLGLQSADCVDQHQPTREVISTPEMSHKHSNKDPSHLQ